MNFKTRSLVVAVVISLAAMLAGCGQKTNCTGTGFGSNDISNAGSTSTCGTSGGIGSGGGGGNSTFTAFAYDIDQAGTVDGIGLSTTNGATTLAALANFTTPTIPSGDPGLGMVVAQQKFVYAAFEQSTSQIFGWSIDSATGGLTTLSGFPMTVSLTVPLSGYNHIYLTTNPAGTLLFISEAANQDVLVYSISAAGALTPVAGSPFPTGIMEPGNMAVDSQGKFLFVCEDSTHSSTSLEVFAIQSDGSLSDVPGNPFPFPMWQVQSDASGKFLIGTTGSSVQVSDSDDTNLYVFNIDQTTGVISPVSGSPFPTIYSPFFIAAQPNPNGGSFVYSFSFSAGGYNPVEGFQLDSNGALSALSASPFSNLSTAIWGQFDQSGNYLFIYRNINASPELGVLALDSSGTLSEPTSTLTLGASGYWAVTDPPTN
jgi:6-phosphogluconolactonase